MTAVSADQALMGLARSVLADVVASQQILALAEVRGYERTVRGRTEEVRPFERLEGEAVHEHVGLSGLPPESLYQLADYKNDGYFFVNHALRSGYTAAAQKVRGFPSQRSVDNSVAAIDGAFTIARPTTSPVVVYRGAGGFSPERITPGTVLHDPAYMSSTTDAGVAERFARTATGGSPRVIRITVPAGEKLVSYENLVTHGHIPSWDPNAKDSDEEHEVLLPRGRSLRVTAVHGNTIEAEMMPVEKPAPVAVPAAVPAKTPAQLALEKAMAYKKGHSVAATQLLLSRTAPGRSRRFVWGPGDVQITRPPIPPE